MTPTIYCYGRVSTGTQEASLETQEYDTRQVFERLSASHLESIILRIILCSLFSFQTLAELLFNEFLVVSQLFLTQESQRALSDYCVLSSVRTELLKNVSPIRRKQQRCRRLYLIHFDKAV
jgi:hypothetical protein